MEATQMPINREINREDMLHMYSGILLSHKKEQTNAICSNMDEPLILSEMSQTEKDMYHIILLICRI